MKIKSVKRKEKLKIITKDGKIEFIGEKNELCEWANAIINEAEITKKTTLQSVADLLAPKYVLFKNSERIYTQESEGV